MPASAYLDMADALEHALRAPGFAATDDPKARAEMLALAVCARLAERRNIYIPLPASVLSERNRARRDAAIVAQFDTGVHVDRIVARSPGLSRRQVKRILRRSGRAP